MQATSAELSHNTKLVEDYLVLLGEPLNHHHPSQVYKAIDQNQNNRILAVKIIPAHKILSDERTFNTYLNIHNKLDTPNVVKMVDLKRTQNNLYVFFEYCENGSLENIIQSNKTVSEKTACAIIRQIAAAFLSIEKANLKDGDGAQVCLMHRNLRPDHILLHKGSVKLADFSYSKLINVELKYHKRNHTILGTPMYMAPEILVGQAYSSKCDVWSAGVILYQLLFGRFPWIGYSPIELYNNIKSKPLEFPRILGKKTSDLLVKMLTFDDESRASWSDVYEHPVHKQS